MGARAGQAVRAAALLAALLLSPEARAAGDSIADVLQTIDLSDSASAPEAEPKSIPATPAASLAPIRTFKNISLAVIDRANGVRHVVQMPVGTSTSEGTLKIAAYACRQNGSEPPVTAAYLMLSDPVMPVFAGWIPLERPSAVVWPHPVYTVLPLSCTP